MRAKLQTIFLEIIFRENSRNSFSKPYIFREFIICKNILPNNGAITYSYIPPYNFLNHMVDAKQDTGKGNKYLSKQQGPNIKAPQFSINQM